MARAKKGTIYARGAKATLKGKAKKGTNYARGAKATKGGRMGAELRHGRTERRHTSGSPVKAR